MSDVAKATVRVEGPAPLRAVQPLADEDPRAVELLRLRSAAELREAESNALVSLLGTVTGSFDRQRESVDQRLDEIAALAAEFGLRLAGVVLGEELRDGRGLERRARTALEALGGPLRQGRVELRTHPDGVSTLNDTFANEDGVTVVADAEMALGAVTADSLHGASTTIDPTQQLHTLTESVRDELEGP